MGCKGGQRLQSRLGKAEQPEVGSGTNCCGSVNRIMSVYVLLRTVVSRWLRAKVDRHIDTIEGLSQVITCGPHVWQGIHYYTLIMIIGP